MNAPDRLKLQAIDEEDLAVLSAHIQDAVLKVGDLTYLPKEKRFAIAMNRFGWEVDDDEATHQRRRSALVFDRVTAAQCSHLRRDHPTRCWSCSPSASSPPTPPPATSRFTSRRARCSGSRSSASKPGSPISGRPGRPPPSPATTRPSNQRRLEPDGARERGWRRGSRGPIPTLSAASRPCFRPSARSPRMSRRRSASSSMMCAAAVTQR